MRRQLPNEGRGSRVGGQWPGRCVRSPSTQHAIRNTPHVSRFTFHVSRPSAFTLIELMIVIGLMALLATISVPAIRGMVRNESMRKAAQDAQEVCQNARARAILGGAMTEVVIHADPPTMEVAGAGPKTDDSGLVAHFELGGDVGVESIKVNGVQYKDADMTRVRFFPNGTCDEFRMVLLRPRDNLRRGIFCEVTTSLATVETDQNVLMNEMR
ncbi:MAG: hypothetical protein C5B50_29720 [Verrucomicrobia bacterium]|nr:MAG: hypothetical protein C5B50_29720 [Verrucomicrobiota bacterium]